MMEDLTLYELRQLVSFYRNKASELEAALLAAQLKSARPVVEEKSNKKTTDK
jgi:hypothetical protein